MGWGERVGGGDGLFGFNTHRAPAHHAPIHNAATHGKNPSAERKKGGGGGRGPGPGKGGGKGETDPHPPGADSPAPPDWGYSRPRGAEREDQDYRLSHPGQLLRSAYLTLVGENPDLDRGDYRSAEAQLARIDAALDFGYNHPGTWTRLEWRRLHRMREKWRRRAAGEDARFQVVGNRRGGLTQGEQDEAGNHRALHRMRRRVDRAGTGDEDYGHGKGD